ncbi:hypothetical protein [Streptomyces sp. NPDC002265]|uniref:hypothetical protein n=1 Tax=Streptomyces sp. NPDC002265 TaxID=3154415 RepID=UPI003318BF91
MPSPRPGSFKGHEAVSWQVDPVMGYVATPIRARRGLLARLHYLTRSDRARAAAREAGLTATPRTIRAWLAGTRSPSHANLAAIEQAYRAVRRENVARYLLARLSRDGRGTWVEFHPLNQSKVTRPQLDSRGSWSCRGQVPRVRQDFGQGISRWSR